MLVFVITETASSQMKKKIHVYKFMVQVKEKPFKENQNFYTLNKGILNTLIYLT